MPAHQAIEGAALNVDACLELMRASPVKLRQECIAQPLLAVEAPRGILEVVPALSERKDLENRAALWALAHQTLGVGKSNFDQRATAEIVLISHRRYI